MRRRRLLVLTGSRAEYGILRPVLDALARRGRVEASLLVTGTHLSPVFGHTIDEIRADGRRIAAEADVVLSSDARASMAASVGLGVLAYAQVVERERPDLFLVYGDRTEALAGAIASAYLEVPVVHMHGGDTAAGYSIDDANRHAITKFAHLHLPATERHAERIRRMGEDPKRIHVVGSPALDVIRAKRYPDPVSVARRHGIDPGEPFLLVVQHALFAAAEEATRQMEATLGAVERLGIPALWSYPNADAGGRGLLAVLERARALPFVRVVPSLPHGEFLALMSRAAAIVGNSSSALIEAPAFGLPAVNVGDRQKGRDRGENVIDVPHEARAIERAVRRGLQDRAWRARLRRLRSPYGDGRTSPRVARLLETTPLGPSLLVKPWHA